MRADTCCRVTANHADAWFNAGSVVALTKLGPLTIHNLVLPNLKSYMARLEPELNDSKPLKRLEASKGRVYPPPSHLRVRVQLIGHS